MEFDKRIEVPLANKNGESLSLLRKISQEQISKDNSKVSGVYYLFSGDELVGKFDAFILNTRGGNEVELECFSDPVYRGRGNMNASMPTVLEDIFQEHAFDGYNTRPGVISDIDTVSLAIAEDNLASQKIAMNNGFKQNKVTEAYEMTKNEFLELKSGKVKDK